jgi:pimeloyl-ACP methyl ester carboxylesterase
LDASRLATDGCAPASIVLVHGAGSGPWIYDTWVDSFPGLHCAAPDLQVGLDVSRASMDDYAARVAAAAVDCQPPVSLCGWSMGGLVAMLAALTLEPPPHSLILIESSPPAEVQGLHPEINLETVDGTFDPEVLYGPFPADVPARPESELARAERKRGISIPRLPCRSLVIYGDEFPDERGRQIAHRYGSGWRAFPGLSHWDLVRDQRAREAIATFLQVGEGHVSRRESTRS